MAAESAREWSFAIDRGGTFTDTIARDPEGRIHLDKRLSSETAPVALVTGTSSGIGLATCVERGAHG